MVKLNYQQATVMEQAKSRLATLYQFNDMLRKRVAAVCTASTAIVGIVTAAKFLPDHSLGFGVESILLGVVCLLSVLMYLFASASLLPAAAPIPGTTDLNLLFTEYLATDIATAYNNFLGDTCNACELALEQNNRNAENLKRVLITFQVQIAVLGLAIAWSGFGGLA